MRRGLRERLRRVAGVCEKTRYQTPELESYVGSSGVVFVLVWCD